jgi:hypothetical protein
MRGAKAFAAMVLLATLAASPTGAGSPTGIRGTVIRSPTTPVCREGKSCSAPAAGVSLVVTRNGTVVARATTAMDGSFRIVLAPGRYVVRLGRPPRIGGMPPRAVRIWQGQFTTVRLVIDTGIR